MDLIELKQEQLRLASKIVLRDSFTKLKTIGGSACLSVGKNLLSCVVICDFPSLQLKEKKIFLLPNPLPHIPGYTAYREMPAIIEAFNQLSEEPDVLFVYGQGIDHPRRFGVASHLGLALQKPTIGVTEKLSFGSVDQGKIMANSEMLGFEVVTREHANPLYVSPGNLITFGAVLDIVQKCIRYPHKLPEPLHLAHKIAKKKAKEISNKK